MPTIAEIEANLLLASSTGNKPLLNSTLAGILPEQFPLITVYGGVLSNLTALADPVVAKNMTRSLMSTAGTFLDAADIGDAMLVFSQNGNYGALDALTDYLTPAQIDAFGAGSDVGQTLLNIAANDTALPDDDIAIKNAVQNLMGKLGAQSSAASIGDALLTFAENKNYKAMDAVTDHLTEGQKAELGASTEIFETLTNLIPLFGGEVSDPEAINAAVRNLMSKLGPFIPYYLIGDLLLSAAMNPDLMDSLDALTDYLTPEQIPLVGQFGAGNALGLGIVQNFSYGLIDEATAVSAIRNLLGKLGDYVDAGSIAGSISGAIMAAQNPYGVIDAVTDYLTESQKIELGSTHASYNLNDILYNTYNTTPEQIEQGLRNYLNKVGDYIDPVFLGDALVSASSAPDVNAAIIDALTDGLTPEQVTALGEQGYVGTAITNISWSAYPGETEPQIADLIRNLMNKFGPGVSSDDIGFVLTTITQNGAFLTLDALTDKLTVDQKMALGASGYTGSALLNIVAFNDPFSTEDDASIGAAIDNLMKKLGAFADVESIGTALETLSYGDVMFLPPLYDAIDGILDYLTPQQVLDLGQTYHPYYTLANLIWADFGFPDDDNTILADAVGNVVDVLGDVIDVLDLSVLMFSAVQNNNSEVLKAIVDNLSETKIAEIIAEKPLMDDVLAAIPNYLDDTFNPEDDMVSTKAIHNLMSVLGESLNGAGIGEVVTQSAFFTNNYKAMDAATDYLTAEQLENLMEFGDISPNFPTQAIVMNIAQNGGDLFEGANAIRDLMHKIGGALSLYDFYEQDVAQAAGEFGYWTGELGAFGMDAVLGELPTELLTSTILDYLNSPEPSENILAISGVTLGTTSADIMNGSDLVEDRFIALAGNDTLQGLGGDDQLYGDAGKDTLYGGLDNDILHGGADKDTLYGDDGDDIVFGGTGADTLYGGAGADAFWFDANDKGTGVDVIKDFSLLDGDTINISDVLEQYDPNTDALSGFVRLTESGADTLLQVDMTGPGVPGGFATIAKLEGVTGLDLDTLVGNGTIVTV